VSGMAIAICSMAARFPGAASPEDLWRLVIERRSAAREIPPGRWPVDPPSVHAGTNGVPDRASSLRGCFLDPVELDPALPIDASGLDEVQRLALQVGLEAWRAARTAGIDRSRVGVVLANIALPTESASAQTRALLGGAFARAATGGDASFEPPGIEPAPLERHTLALPASLLCSALGFGGGALTLDAACASSLYAIRLACMELEAGRADAMLAGGVCRPQSIYTQIGFSQLQALSPSGRCAPFDRGADGLVVGEGAGIFVLKRLADAEAQGDEILGVIRAVGLSNDVAGSLLSPASEGQLRAMRAAWEAAGWAPGEVDLVECHGTGTPRGDAVEIASLRELLGTAAPTIGSVKANVGHTLTAAGAAALCKVLLALRHETLPPATHADEPIDTGSLLLRDAPARWERPADRPRRAAVSAFGFGGINGHLLVEEYVRGAPPPRIAVASPAVAIVGIGAHVGRLAGRRAFREALLRGEPVLDERPASRWHGAGGDAPRGAWLDALEIPVGRYKVPPREIPALLPQQLLALETALEAAEDARALGEAPRLRAGAVIGLGLDPETTGFHLRWTLLQSARRWAAANGFGDEAAIAAWVEELLPALGEPLDAARVLGALGGVVAGRIARELSLGGPSFAVGGAEGAGLRALDVAVRLLQRGEVDAMVVGAVDLAGDLRAVRAADALRPFSRTGATRPFDAAGDGPAVGEGAVALVVKRLDDARRDGDRIYAVIRGMGAASGGGAAAYERALRQAWAEAGLAPERASLVAAHGSADPDEDRLEAEALHRFFGAAPRPDDARCALASARGVLGDTGAASGLASVAFAALALFHEVLPPLPGIHTPRRCVDWEAGPFHLPRAPQPWLRDRGDGPRVAGVSSIGLDGTCQHVVLAGEEHAADAWRAERARPLGERAAAIFVVQAENEGELAVRIGELRALARRGGSLEVLAAAWWREHGVRRAPLTRAFVAGDLAELRRALDRPASPGAPIDGEIAFVYPGSGNHWVGMGRGLGLAFPAPIRALDATTAQLRTQSMPAWYAPWRCDWSEGAETEAARRLASSPARMMLGQVAHGIAATAVLRSLGVEPQAAIGYSLGESAALFSMGAWTDRDGMFARTMATSLFTTELAGAYEAARRAYGAPSWHVAVINRAADEVRGALVGSASLLIVNAPGECVVGGSRADVEATIAALGCEALPLEGVPTVHCALARDAAEDYRALHVQPTRAPEGVRIYSCGWARPYVPSPDACADSILHNALHGFDFPQVIERAWSDGVRIFVEAGPQGSCTRMIGRILAGREHLAVSICQRGVDPARSVLQALARLAEAGVAIDLASLYGPEGGIELEAPRRQPTVRVVVGREPAALPPPPWRRAAARAAEAGPPSLGAPSGATMASPLAQQPATSAAPSVLAASAPVAQPTAPLAPHAAAAAVASAPTPGAGTLAANETARALGAAAAPSHLPAPGAALHAGNDHMGTNDVRRHAEGLVAAQALLAQAARTAAAHAAFLAQSAGSFALQRQAIEQRAALLGQLLGAGHPLPAPARGTVVGDGPLGAAPAGDASALRPERTSGAVAHASHDGPPAPATPWTPAVRTDSAAPQPLRAGDAAAPATAALPAPEARRAAPLFDRDLCMEFAVGSIGRMLGPAFAAIDAHPTRVRLPDEPLMLVDRIVHLEGEPNSLGAGRVVTEHDVLPGAWYLDGGRAPVCISVEAGQADLFLSAWLGIDHRTKGERLYRLLDARVIFHRDLPRPGETVRYDIRVDRFIRQGDTYLMFFHFDGTIDGAPFITMRDGCAGFFSPQQLASGRGIVGELPTDRPAPREGSRPFRPLAEVGSERFDDAQIAALRAGDLEAAFGPAFAGITLPPALRLPSGRMELVDRIVELDPAGGRYGLGRITGEADIAPDDWFLTCHFSDDPVMPGTLMYECCLHTLRVYLLRLGWILPAEAAPADLHVAPIVGATSKLRCRGQVTPTTKKVRYRIDIKEIGYDPEPYVLADASMFVDDLHAIEMEGMSLRYAGVDGAAIERFWEERRHPAFGRDHVLAFAAGRPSDAFGARYAPFDEGKRLARLPRPPFSFVDEIRATAGRRWHLDRGAAAEARFHLAPDAWYFAGGGSGEMPYAVLLEAALQPCGWLAAYGGAALRSEKELFFRNLEGEAVQHLPVRPGDGALVTRCTLDSVSEAGGMILLAYRFATSSDRGLVFEGTTRFGFFPEASLAQQAGLGLDPATLARPTAALQPLPRAAPLRPEEAGRTGDPAQAIVPAPPPGTGLPAGCWQMLDEVALDLESGRALGVLHVDPDAWFFHAHFFGDPVMPGSLGVEAFLQLVQRWIHARFPGAQGRVVPATGAAHRWTYRGQVRPGARRVEVIAHVTAQEGTAVRADGWLLCDGQPIYAMRGYALRLVEDA